MMEKGEVDLKEPVSPESAKTVDTDDSYDPEACQSVQPRRSCWRLWRRQEQQSSVEQRLSKHSEPYRSITRCLDQCPQGYSQAATFQSSDRNFLLFRGFGYLHTRVLLGLQCDIEQLEQELDDLDKFDKNSPGDPRKLKCKARDDMESKPEDIKEEFRANFERTRPQVLAELRTKLLEYDEVLLKTKEIATLQKPSRRDWESVRNFYVEDKPLVDGEQKFIRRKEDIVTLRSGRESAAFDSMVERALSRIDRFLMRFKCDLIRRLFLTPELRAKSTDDRIRYYAPARVDTLVNIIITMCIFVLMILPVVALWYASNVGSAGPFEAIGILIIFTLVFGCAMSSLTKATRQELFAASAAYCAVLVVFISNFSTQGIVIEDIALQGMMGVLPVRLAS